MSTVLDSFAVNRSGSVGPVVHSHNGSGPYTRPRTLPFDPKTIRQLRVRARFNTVRTRWTETLTSAQRATWADYATRVTTPGRNDTRNRLTGQQLFVRCNVARIRPFMGFRDTAPLISTLGSAQQVLLQKTVILSELRVIFDNSDEWVTQSGAFLIVYVSDTFPLTVNFFAGPFRFAGVIIGNTAAPPRSPTTVIDPFPALPLAHRWARTRVVFDDGRATTTALLPFKPGFF